MNTSNLIPRLLMTIAAALVGLSLVAVRAWSQDGLRLKPGAKGELCLKCHADFDKILKKSSVHPLLKKGDCSGCHTPHTSDHAGLLATGITKLCSSCHQAVVPEKPKSAHQIVYQGNCKKCHDSHASDNPFLLAKAGNALCLECHPDISEIVQKAAFKHDPLRKENGCLNCHAPHASPEQRFLLKDAPPALCKNCHKTGEPGFARKHMNFPVSESSCTSCHDPHGSASRSILLANTHTSVRDGKCLDCHLAPEPQGPPRTKRQGIELCRECHQKMVDEAMGKNRLHWPLAARRGCLSCHAPHGAKKEKLLSGPIAAVCGECHADTLKLQQWSIRNPKNEDLCEPVKTGNCIVCHAPHASDNVLLFSQPSINSGLCGRCHNWNTHSTHPLGDKVIDQRNPNLTLDCLSCHKSCGTGNKPSMLHYATTYELCVQCHTERTR